ncbi:hypothetical protein F4861DRAFT_488995 [Xylaria intraflava]|nr:hypothetical protein F4861DRAFT_488995 [Xylaria intraflava]
MTLDRHHCKDKLKLIRPKMPVHCNTMPNLTITPSKPSGTFIDEQQGTPSTSARPMSRGQFVNFDQLELPSPGVTGSAKFSWNSRRSTLKAVGRTLSLGLDVGKSRLGRTKTVIGAAAAAGKEATRNTASKLKNQFVANAAKTDDDKFNDTPSRSSTSSDAKSLFHRRRLPKLKIPDLTIAVEEALNTACSTDTQSSENYALLELSPTSRHLKDQMLSDHPDDVVAEYHNMLSARRRVRKGKFGAEVMRYRQARPTWDDSWTTRSLNDNMEDRELLRILTDAVQEQKDHATRLVQRNPDPYPGLQPVSAPGCTLKTYWQHKSSYR